MNIFAPIKATATLNAAIEMITPQVAEKYLTENNTRNRNIRQKLVNKIASDIVNNRWAFNGATIVFGDDGVLLDGQHRLSAICKAKTSVPSIVVYGVPAAAMTTIDCGAVRGAHDVAAMQGYLYSRRITGAARMLISLRNGAHDGRCYASNGEITEFLARHSRLQDSAAATEKMIPVVFPAIGIAWHYLAYYVANRKIEADLALKSIQDGIPNYPGDPMHVFRERLIRMSAAEKGGTNQRASIMFTMISAWNDFLDGREMTICKMRKTFVKMTGVDYSQL